MAKDTNNKTELSTDSRIKTEIERLSIYFQDLPENKLAIICPLIEQAAFMRITLDDLQKYVAEHGAVEHYSNGATQQGLKPSSALQSYNQLIKNYTAVVKSLAQYLPPMKRQEFIEQPSQIDELNYEKIKAEAETERIKSQMLGNKWSELLQQEKDGEITNNEKWDLIREFQHDLSQIKIEEIEE